MPVIVDPATVLPDAGKRWKPSQVMLWLLYPVVFAVGLVIGIVVGIKQGQSTANADTAAGQIRVNSRIVPNANVRVNTNAVSANTNVSNAFLNINAAGLGSADALKISAATQADLDSRQQQDIARLVDTTASVTDQVRQRDVIALKYTLLAYTSVKRTYPSTDGRQIRLEAKDDNILYQALKTFYGGNFNLRVDPESPTYYYGYTSDGQTFGLTAFLVGKNNVFQLTDAS